VLEKIEMRHHLPKIQLIWDRKGFILKRCAGKTVLHLGCASMEQLADVGAAKVFDRRLTGACQ